jgi:CheY-like chemotaxis protein
MMTSAPPVEILFVDDSVAHVRIAREALAAEGVPPYRLTIASTGKEALDRLARRPPFENTERPDVILLDLDLPLISGLDVLTSVKTSRDLRSIPVVVLVRSPRREDVEECYERGANSVVEYPIPLEQLAETVRRVVLYWGRLNLRERRDGLTT